MEVRIRRVDGSVVNVDEGRFVDPRDAAAPNEYLQNVRAGSVAIGDVVPRIIQLEIDGANEFGGWKQVDLPGPGVLRSMEVGVGNRFDASNIPIFQANTFFAQPGVTQPLNRETALQSNGVGALAIPFGGPWWITPIRLDIGISLTFQPMLSGDVAASFQAVDSCGIGNLHTDSGFKLLAAANDGVDPTLPAVDTAMIVGAYRARKMLRIHVPSVLLNGTGGANWINGGDAVVDQTANGTLVGWSPFLRSTNFSLYKLWHLPSDILNSTGSGISTLRGGDILEFAGISRWVGPIIVFNLNPAAAAFVHVQEFT